jgi:membrane protein
MSDASGTRRGPLAILKDAVSHFREHDMTDHAAALTYYSLMSLFPGLLVGVVLLGVLGQQGMVTDVTRYLTDNGAPRETVDLVRSSLDSVVAGKSGANTPLLILGLLLALYGASGLFGALGRALNVVLETGEDRGFVRRKLTDIGSTLLVIVLVLVAMVLVFVGGGVAHDLAGTIGLGSTAATVWNVVRWPAAIVLTMVTYAYVYFAAPDNAERRFRWISAGAVAAVLIWIVASAGFFFYVSNFGSYNATYGAFAAVVILLIWLWLTNNALLLGAEINRALDRARSPAADPVARGVQSARETLPPAGPEATGSA